MILFVLMFGVPSRSLPSDTACRPRPEACGAPMSPCWRDSPPWHWTPALLED
jgi:hypothetical protein